ncbi:uncharacterized protein LOC118271831 [Spodoptera frugiperda]|uniref:Uncharacterized protein LOC118271831 n=1 Tax=Spodoptera frugiperda TaxID=7108 RepID=A0A9R0D820_SPOFR|nr:uncharacterized protein LOC118271831 [Spodoptera frugiperda]
MDKNAYETYEFLPSNGSETEPDQFFVLQDDGTFLLNRQVQYVAQVQDVKEVLEDVQPCTVYGVSSQQFFVDVDNSAELISVSGDFEQNQFILPEGDNGLYSNSFLLQPSTSGTTEPMEEDVIVDQYKQQNTQDVDVDVDVDVVTHTSKQGNNFTEITLSDEQYQMLEQKGWILLESNDKIFVLNTLGLHDITTNDKLIQKLKNEAQNGASNILGVDEGTLKIESISEQFPQIGADSLSSQQDTVEFVIKGEEPSDTIESVQLIVDDKDSPENTISDITTEKFEEISMKEEYPSESLVREMLAQPKPNITLDNEPRSIKIKTKLTFKDIPDKIVLGKSANGKRLVAKVRKPQSNIREQHKVEKSEDDQVLKQVDENQQYNVTGLHELDFVNLIQTTLRAGIQPSFTEEDIASAEGVITQLLKMPNLKHFLVGYDLIVTKAKNNKDEFGLIYNRSSVSFITGRVADKDGSPGFEHVPNLLQTIKQKAEEQNVSQSDEVYSCIEEKEAKENFTIYHIHITETKCSDNVVRVSVTLNKRQLPVNLVFDLKKRYPTTVFGCSSCAALFKTEQALKEHQENCIDTDDMLTIDTTNNTNSENDDVIIDRTGKETVFSCAQCNVTFTKLSNIQRHMKSHLGTKQQILQTTRVLKQGLDPKPAKIFKCKMCPSTYFHSASLSKHIVTRHIKVKANKNEN